LVGNFRRALWLFGHIRPHVKRRFPQPHMPVVGEMRASKPTPTFERVDLSER
jgi:hypothetical protein